MKLISGKSEIVYLLTKVIEKYEKEHGVHIAKNSNRKNYEPIALILSEISNQLPNTADTLHHEVYPIDYNPKNLDYPHRKYDITGNQVKDAYFNQIISNPRPFMVDACYIYLYGVGRKGFEFNPLDENLLDSKDKYPLSIIEPNTPLPQQKNNYNWLKAFNNILKLISISSILALFVCVYKWKSAISDFHIIKNDMKILPYTPSQVEIDSLEGIWISYIGSPQARISDANRYHLVATNIVEFTYKHGYFTVNRFGVSFDHDGYAQFLSPWLASIFTTVKNKNKVIESPRHSLMVLNKETKYKSLISTSWNFDVGDKNMLIGIREVFIKQGKGGHLEEVFNSVENATCKCKIIKWHKDDGTIQVFQLKNQLLDSLPEPELKKLLDENSILLRVPIEGLLLSDSTRR